MARDVTSDYDPSISDSIFGSLTSSVHEHVWEFGRRYHMFRYGRYPIPNDDDEYKRESLMHIIVKELLGGKLLQAPIGDHPQRIIDLGTGFGEWAIEAGERFPSARVTGVDLSPIQPVWIPANVDFLVDDVEDEWVHADDFDLVRLGFLGCVIKDREKLVRNIYRNLKPGGWTEWADPCPRARHVDGAPADDHPLNRFYDVCGAVLQSRYGFDIMYVERLAALLRAEGFVHVQQRVYHVPIGQWPAPARQRMVGRYFQEVMMDFVVAIAARPLVEGGMDRAEADELVGSVRAAMEDRAIRAYFPIYFVWAQKDRKSVV